MPQRVGKLSGWEAAPKCRGTRRYRIKDCGMGLLEETPKAALELLKNNYFELLILPSKFSLWYLRSKNVSNFFRCFRKYGLGTH